MDARNMNMEELKKRLVEEGCSQTHYSLGKRYPGGAFCLIHEDGKWRVLYSERNLDEEPLFEGESEAAACEFFFKYMTTSILHTHLVGYFISLKNAEALADKLSAHGIATHRNDIPYHGWDDPRFRVFVTGKDVFKAQELLGELPVRDHRD
ncbi:MAG: SPOR domain-containing protein [Anaerolineales bacterium]|nr:hypothetical protein [Anaerolineales bacterium]MCB9145453.1 SPOR domain-containing protein [Anaerolineales bacterium]